MTYYQLIQAIAAECGKRGSQKALAEEWDISEQYLSDVLNERREPGDLILRKMGLRKVVTCRSPHGERGLKQVYDPSWSEIDTVEAFC